MKTDRRTRDRVRLCFWAVLTVVCLVAVLVARQQQAQALQRKVDAAQERAVRFTQNVLADELDARRVARPIEKSGYDALLAELKHGLFNDQRVVRVRVWRSDGLLVFTTDDPAKIGVTTSDDGALRSALRGDLVSSVATESFAADGATTPAPTALLSTFIPLRTSDKANVFGAVQIDNDYGFMVDASSSPWRQMQIAFAFVALLCLVMTIVSFVWSRRPEEVTGFGPSRREARVEARDEKKSAAARAEVSTLRERVKELEGKTKSVTEQQLELEKLRGRVAEFEQAPPARTETSDPAEVAELKAHGKQLEAQARGAESRVTQLQSRVTEMEAQLRVTTDQVRIAQTHAEELEAAAANAGPSTDPAPLLAQLEAAAATEVLLRDELDAARTQAQSAEQERDALIQTHADEARSQQGQMDEVRAQARLAEEERQRILAEAAEHANEQPAISADAQSRIAELIQQLERSEAERAMLRAGRPETVYEARNRELEDQLAELRAATGTAGVGTAVPAQAVDPDVIAALEARIAAAEERARDAERRLDEAKPRRSRSRTAARANGNARTNGDAEAVATDEHANGDGSPAEAVGSIDELVSAAATAEDVRDDDAPDEPTVDGSELRSRLVRSTDARRRGISTPTAVPTPGPTKRR